MKVLTWNVNGIRASKVPIKTLLDELDADIICFQETKVTRDQLDEPTAVVDGFSSYFSFSKVRSGYSGVATYCKDHVTPLKAEEGLTGLLATERDNSVGCYGDTAEFSEDELHALDSEGRVMITQHKIREPSPAKSDEKLLTIINVYCPRADPEKPERKAFKMRFYELLQIRAEALLKNGSHVIILGDVNTSHKPIDHCDPGDDQEFLSQPGRQWLDQFLYMPTTNNVSVEEEKSHGLFIDTFRHFYPDKTHAFTCWNTMTGARQTNYGTRIDYIFADRELVNSAFMDCIIMSDFEGSDHCPVKATLNCESITETKYPLLCTKFWPEFLGKQKKLSEFFTRGCIKSVDSVVKNNGFAMKDAATCNTAVKRPGENLQKRETKKLKSEGNSKQANLMNFFGKKSLANPNSDKLKNMSTIGQLNNRTETHSHTGTGCAVDGDKAEESQQSHADEDIKKLKPSSQKDLWKNVLKGPSPLPLCKGHKEPCVLRTVKKDSLNFGRKFYVCARPQGHASNPEARCDHFEWVDKKTKK